MQTLISVLKLQEVAQRELFPQNIKSPGFWTGRLHCWQRSRLRRSRRTWRSTASSSTRRTLKGNEWVILTSRLMYHQLSRSNKASAELAARRQKLMSSFSEWKEQKEEEYAMARWDPAENRISAKQLSRWSLRDKRMALRDGIDTDYDEGDQFEEETVRQFILACQMWDLPKLC